MPERILIADDVHEILLTRLKDQGYDVHYRPHINRDEIERDFEDYIGIVIRSKTDLDRNLLSRATRLRFIARAGAGVDRIDEAFCRENNIVILNAPEANRDALGEHMMGMLLALLNKIHMADAEIRNGIWDRQNNRGIELSGRTVGIIGFGHMGSAFAQRLAGFNCRVIAYDKYREGYSDQLVEEAPLDMIFRETDILSLHVPLNDETRGHYDRTFFKKFKKQLIVLNSARGPILPLDDLLSLMDEGYIAGAALDVLENERVDQLSPPEKARFDALIKRKNIILTPHTAGWSYESYRKISEVLGEKIGLLKEFLKPGKDGSVE